MKTLFALSALAELIMLTALFLLGRRYVLGGLRHPYAGPQAPLVPADVALIVPITGAGPTVRAGLKSLLAQDYPGIRYVLVTSGEADPATALVRQLIDNRPEAMLVFSGTAIACGQKNHNLLAGLRALNGWGSILVFCDSTHLARPDLAARLAEPLAQGKAVISSGFHRVVPLDHAAPTLGLLNVCLALHCMQAIPAITQPWGGAMAVTREAFERYNVAEVWAANIVDDFSMGPLLVRHGIRTWPVSLACLETPQKGVTFAHLEDWLTRQLLYLKFCTPEMWLGALAVLWLFLFPPLAGIVGGLGAMLGAADGWWLGAALAYFAAFTGMGLCYRSLCPRPVPFWAWTRGFFATFLMTGWCYLRTWATFTMSWRGIAYKVAWGGRVKEIIRR